MQIPNTCLSEFVMGFIDTVISWFHMNHPNELGGAILGLASSLRNSTLGSKVELSESAFSSNPTDSDTSDSFTIFQKKLEWCL